MAIQILIWCIHEHTFSIQIDVLDITLKKLYKKVSIVEVWNQIYTAGKC